MPDMKRRLKNASKFALRKIFEQGQRLGFDVLPRHFYSEIPDIRELKTSGHWKVPYSMIGLRGLDMQSQADFVRECCTPPIIEQIRSKNIHAYAEKTKR